MRAVAAGEELTHDWAMTDDDSYEMANETYKGKYRLLERENGRIFHPSRNEFIPICSSKFFPDAETDFRAYTLLAPVIVRFFEMKKWSAMDGDERRAYKEKFRES